MARYIDADKLSEMIQHKADTLIEGKEAFLYVAKWLELLPGADVVEWSECEKWYHEYHVIKDALKQEKEYHRSTEKLADKYQTELEKAKQEADRLAVELEAERARRLAEVEYWRGEARQWKNDKYNDFKELKLCKFAVEKTTTRLFEEIETLMKKHVFPVVREGVIEIESEPFLIIDPQDWAAMKNRYLYGISLEPGFCIGKNEGKNGPSGTPVPTGDNEGGGGDGR